MIPSVFLTICSQLPNSLAVSCLVKILGTHHDCRLNFLQCCAKASHRAQCFVLVFFPQDQIHIPSQSLPIRADKFLIQNSEQLQPGPSTVALFKEGLNSLAPHCFQWEMKTPGPPHITCFMYGLHTGACFRHRIH